MSAPDPVLDDLLAFVHASPTPFHAVEAALARLEAAGFRRVSEHEPLEDLGPGKYALAHGGTSLFAFALPEGTPKGFRLAGAHTDSPNLRLKPKPDYVKEGYAQLGVEVYGGALLNSWLDKDLGLAGRLVVAGDGGRGLRSVLARLDRPLCRVTQLAIHLDRDVNDKGVVLNKQEHLAPIFGLAEDGAPTALALLAEAAGVREADVLGHDAMLFDLQKPVLGGRSNELVFSARLDNLAMCHASVTALARSADAATAEGLVPFAALFDHEEVGSGSATGAESHVLARLLERIARGRGAGPSPFERLLAGSLCVSADMAHAVHPNYPGRHEERHKPVLNGGPVVKFNAQQRYATTGVTAAFFRGLAKAADVPCQSYAHRTDLPCGSTIGPIVAMRLGLRTVDVGNPMLSMHSSRELGGARDADAMTRVLDGFFAAADPEA